MKTKIMLTKIQNQNNSDFINCFFLYITTIHKMIFQECQNITQGNVQQKLMEKSTNPRKKL